MAEEKNKKTKKKKDDKKTKAFYDWATTGIPVKSKYKTNATKRNGRMKKATYFFSTIKDILIKPCLFQIEGIDPVYERMTKATCFFITIKEFFHNSLSVSD